MGFQILTDLVGKKMFEGQIIEYRVRPMFGIPLKWQTEIRQVNEPFSFTDVQLKGPYKKWEHTHTFEQVEGGILMKDKVKYQLPMGVIGTMAHGLFVKGRLEKIFDHRAKTLDTVFNQ